MNYFTTKYIKNSIELARTLHLIIEHTDGVYYLMQQADMAYFLELKLIQRNMQKCQTKPMNDKYANIIGQD